MCDEDLPLTPPEWPEWGDPIRDEAAYRTIAAYAPYENVAARAYPAIFATAGLTDPRVTYWEPAKWVAKLRPAQDRRQPAAAAHQHGGRPRRRLRPLPPACGGGDDLRLRAGRRGPRLRIPFLDPEGAP